jgi:hypothetical protein
MTHVSETSSLMNRPTNMKRAANPVPDDSHWMGQDT